MLSNSPHLCQVLKAFSTELSDALGIREKPCLTKGVLNLVNMFGQETLLLSWIRFTAGLDWYS